MLTRSHPENPTTGFVRQFTSFDKNVRMLLINEFSISAGFFMLMPYLAVYLSEKMALAGWAVGLVIGIRNFSQQGMFLVGGTCTDRLGYKTPIMLGCALRAVGFAMLGIGTSLVSLVAGSLVSGFAGALFLPAVRVGIAEAAGPRRMEAFALCNLCNRLGIVAGPLLGLALTGIDFRLTCLAAALVFTVLTVFQSRTLPSGRPEAAPTGRVVAGVLEVAKNRKLVWFAITMIGSYVLSFQTYLSLPMEAHRLAGDGTAGTLLVASLFLLTGLLTAFCQLRLTPWSRRQLGDARALTTGVLLLGLSFVPMTLPLESFPVPLRFTPLLVSTAMLATGTMMVFPLEMDAVVGLAGGRLVATHYGLYSTIVGAGILVGTLFTGALLGSCWSAGLPSIPWLVLASLGVLCALGVARSTRAMKAELRTN